MTSTNSAAQRAGKHAPHQFTLLAGLVGVAMLTLSAQARDLKDLDVISLAPVKVSNDANATAAARSALGSNLIERAHFEERLAVPTLTWLHTTHNSSKAKTANAIALANSTPERAAREQLKLVADLYKISPAEIDAAPLHHVQQLANGGYLVKFTNALDGIEVFRESATIMLSPTKEAVAVGGFITSTGGAGASSLARAAGTSGISVAANAKLNTAQAVAVALGDYGFAAAVAGSLAAPEASVAAAAKTGGYRFLSLPEKTRSADGTYMTAPARVKDVWYRLPSGLVRAYYIEVQTVESNPIRDNYYAYVVSAVDGQILFRRNLTSDLSAAKQAPAAAVKVSNAQAAADLAFSYRVYAESTGNFLPYTSPIGRSNFPHPTGKPDGVVASFVAPNLITLANFPFSRNDPWLDANATKTKGNNVEAFADLFSPDGIGTPDASECDLNTTPKTDFHACLSGIKSFDYTYDTSKGPTASRAQTMAAVTNMFFMNNYLHDWFYDSGFDEAAGNAQDSNYGRGGYEGDSIFAEGEDFAGKNNANMSTPADGGRPRMRMYVYDGPSVSALTLTSAAGVAGKFTTNTAEFGAKTFSVSGDIVVADPADGCGTTPFNNAASIAGNIAYIDRGTCTFVEKAKNAQAAGAIGVVIGNNRDATVAPGMSGSDPSVTIGVLSISQNDATKLKNASSPKGKIERSVGVDRDGTIDNATIAHEWGHYISNRLIGNASGLSTNQSNGMGEGWADFHALLLLVKESDKNQANNANFSGAYPMGGYTEPGAIGEYYGIRRYPYSRDLAKNPLTLKHIADGTALPTTPAPAFGSSGASNSEVHSTGEVWASMLWQCYSNLLNDNGRLSFTEAQRRMKSYLVAGYTMTPNAPTIVEARDALLSAMKMQDAKDYAACYAGFATRGAGAGAVIPDRYTADNKGVVESFAAAGVQYVSASLTDIPRYCDTDGVLDSGETAKLTITIKNTGSVSLNGTVATVTSKNPHISFPNGNNLAMPASVPGDNVTATMVVKLDGATVPEAADFTIALSDPQMTEAPIAGQESFGVNYDQLPAQSATDDVNSSHTVWTTGSDAKGIESPYTLASRVGVSALDSRWYIPSLTNNVQTWLDSPTLNVASAGNFSFTFKHRFGFEKDATTFYDGGILLISDDNGATWTQIPASALTNGYNGKITETSNPRTGVAAFVGDSASWPALESVTVNLGAAYAGKAVKIRFLGSYDQAGTSNGWEIDDIAFSNITNKPFDTVVADGQHCATVSLSAGSPQQSLVNSQYEAPLQAQLLSADKAPIVGAAVQFDAPTSGASGTFSGGQTSVTVTTDSTGVATAPAFTANGVAGAFKITASTGRSSVDFALTNLAALPLVFANPGTQPIGAKTVELNAVSGSGAPVSYTSNSTDVCTVAGTTVTLLAVGKCSITASVPASGSIPAASITQVFGITADTGPTSGSFRLAAGTVGVLKGAGVVTLETGSTLTISNGTGALGSTLNLPNDNVNLLVQGQSLTVRGLSASTQMTLVSGDVKGQTTALPQLTTGSVSITAPAFSAALVIGGSASSKGTVLTSGEVDTTFTATVLSDGSTKVAVSGGAIVLPCGAGTCASNQSQLSVLAGETLLMSKAGKVVNIILASDAGGAAGDAITVPALPDGVSLSGSFANFSASVARLKGVSLLDSLQTGLQNYLRGTVSVNGNSPFGTPLFSYDSGKLTWATVTPVYIDATVANGVTVLPNGQWQVADSGVLIRLSPSLYDASGLIKLLKSVDAGSTLQINSDGRLLATLQGTRYSVMPSSTLSSSTSPFGFGNTSAGALTYTSAKGEQQVLAPAFTGLERLFAILRKINPGFTMQTQVDGTVVAKLAGQTFKMIPSFLVVTTPAAHVADDYWLDGTTVYINYLDGTSQGLALQ